VVIVHGEVVALEDVAVVASVDRVVGSGLLGGFAQGNYLLVICCMLRVKEFFFISFLN